MFDRFLDRVFSLETFMLLCLVGWFFGLYHIVADDIDRSERERVATEFCYSQNMILVSSDAGKRCVEPSALVKVN